MPCPSLPQVLKRTQKEILVETGQCASGATKGIIALYSPTVGHVKTPYSLKFAYNPLAIVHKVAPEVGMFSGGEDVLIQGQQLCSHNCDDLLRCHFCHHCHNCQPRHLYFSYRCC